MKKFRAMRTASLLLLVVLMTFAIATTAKYNTKVSSRDEARVAHWGFSETSFVIDGLFSGEYADADGLIAKSATGRDLIVPGMEHSTDCRLHRTCCVHRCETSGGSND